MAIPPIDRTQPAIPPAAPRPFARWLWQLVKDVVNEYRRDGVGDLAASITFWTLLSIPAAVLALVSALSWFEAIGGAEASTDLEREIQQLISDTFADSTTLNQAVAELFGGRNAGVLTVASVVAFFSLSRGFAGVIRALDRAYEIEEGRPWWQVRILAVVLGTSTIVIAAGSAVILALLPDLPAGSAFQVLAAPAAFLLIVLWAAMVFHVGPNHRTPWRYDLPGALLTAIGWVLATQGFAVYVRVAGRGNQVQTSVGAVLLGLTLMYLLSTVMLVGAELNDVIGRRARVDVDAPKLRGGDGNVREELSDLVDDLVGDGAGEPVTEGQARMPRGGR